KSFGWGNCRSMAFGKTKSPAFGNCQADMSSGGCAVQMPTLPQMAANTASIGRMRSCFIGINHRLMGTSSMGWNPSNSIPTFSTVGGGAGNLIKQFALSEARTATKASLQMQEASDPLWTGLYLRFSTRSSKPVWYNDTFSVPRLS